MFGKLKVGATSVTDGLWSHRYYLLCVCAVLAMSGCRLIGTPYTYRFTLVHNLMAPYASGFRRSLETPCWAGSASVWITSRLSRWVGLKQGG